MPYEKQTFARKLTLEERVAELERKRQAYWGSPAHEMLHSIISTYDHSSAATPERLLKADAAGLPVESDHAESVLDSLVYGMEGMIHGMKVTIKDADELYVAGGNIEINGVVYVAADQITVDASGLSADTLYYLYVDAATATNLVAGDFTLSTTACVYDHTKGAYYKTGDGTKRWLANVKTAA